MASKMKLSADKIKIKVPTRYLEDGIVSNLFIFTKDLIDENPQVSTIDKPMVLRYYLEGWKYWD
jgi:spermidine synthase